MWNLLCLRYAEKTVSVYVQYMNMKAHFDNT